MALTTLPLIKQTLNIPSTNTSKDSWLEALRVSAETVVKNYCGRDFESATYTEFHSGDGRRVFALRQRPVSSITSLYLDHDGNFGYTDDSFDSTHLMEEGVDYALVLDGTLSGSAVSFSGLVQRIKTVWPELTRTYVPGRLTNENIPSPGNIKVTYVAGYSAVPLDIQYAVAFIVSSMQRNVPLGGNVGSERIGDYSYALFNPRHESFPEIATARQLLSRYREVAW